jgi:hypothetical protein
MGVNPALITANAVEQYVMAGIITSELLGKLNDFKAIVNASVPFPQLIAYLDLQKFLKLSSNFKTSLPKIKSPFLNNIFIFFNIAL